MSESYPVDVFLVGVLEICLPVFVDGVMSKGKPLRYGNVFLIKSQTASSHGVRRINIQHLMLL